MTVFLDLDGTLTDPFEGITGAVAHALRELGLSVPDDLGWIIGPPLIESFSTLGAPDPEAALALYRAHYREGGLFRATVYPGIPDALQQMALGRMLCLATAKPHIYAKEITAHFGLASHLSHEFGPELDGTRNDKAALLTHACATLGIQPETCVMVGDRALDLHAARASGMLFVGAAWGYGRDGELDAADVLCQKVSDLPNAVAALGA